MQLSDLVPGDWYQFHHTRKGVFVARFVDWDTAGDQLDDAAPMLRVEIVTQPGLGQKFLGRGVWYDENGDKHVAPPLTDANLRASLILDITAAEDPFAVPAE